LKDAQRYSSYQKMVRVTSYVLRFINNSTPSSRDARTCGPLTTEERRVAEKTLIRDQQQQSCRDVICELHTRKHKMSITRQLRLYLDEGDFILSAERIHNAHLPESTKFPLLLPPKTHLTDLIIQDAHSRQLHAGVSQTVTLIRQKFWIPSVRQNVGNVIRHCVRCRRIIGKSYSAPDPPPLPTSRVSDEPPFLITGVDYSGALYVNTERLQQQIYICLFTCANTRAVHLEIVPDLTEDSFLHAFRRFASRRSLPRLMISDNATTFHASATQIQRLCNSPTSQSTLTEKGTQWQFIPKRAPWYGGWWERLVGVMKTTLKMVLGRASVNLQTMQTVITEVEAIMNDRPITYVTSGRDAPEPLTLAHLLRGRRLTGLLFTDTSTASRGRSRTIHFSR